MAGWILKLVSLIVLYYSILKPIIQNEEAGIKYIVDSSPVSTKLAEQLKLKDYEQAQDERELIKSLAEGAVLVSSFDFNNLNPFHAFRGGIRAKKFNDCIGEAKISFVQYDAIVNADESKKTISVGVDLCSKNKSNLIVSKKDNKNVLEVSKSGIYSVPLFNLEAGINCFELKLDRVSEKICVLVRDQSKVFVYGSDTRVDNLLKIFPTFQQLTDLRQIPEGAKTLIIIDTPAYKLNPHTDFLYNLAKKGLNIIFLGGANSFSDGNYKGSDLERLLPVISEPREEKLERSKRAIVALIDKSGSMRLDKRIERVRYALKLLIHALRDDDYFGVIGFDTSAFVVLPLIKLGSERETLAARMDNLRAWGGTDPTQALILAKGYLEQLTNIPIKHIIVLTDGEFKHNIDGILSISRIIGESGITISGVLIGDEDSVVMREVVKHGKGSFYKSNDGLDVPEIFLKDIFRRVPHENREFKAAKISMLEPKLKEKYPVTPKLRVWNLTKSKDSATVRASVSSDLTPLWAEWTLGEGVVKAVPFDLLSVQNKEFISWNRYKDFLADIFELKDETNYNAIIKKFGQYAIVTRYSFADELGLDNTVVDRDSADLFFINRNFDSESFVLFFKKTGEILLHFGNNIFLPFYYLKDPEKDTRIAQDTVLFDELTKVGYIQNSSYSKSESMLKPDFKALALFLVLWILGSWLIERRYA